MWLHQYDSHYWIFFQKICTWLAMTCKTAPHMQYGKNTEKFCVFVSDRHMFNQEITIRPYAAVWCLVTRIRTVAIFEWVADFITCGHKIWRFFFHSYRSRFSAAPTSITSAMSIRRPFDHQLHFSFHCFRFRLHSLASMHFNCIKFVGFTATSENCNSCRCFSSSSKPFAFAVVRLLVFLLIARHTQTCPALIRQHLSFGFGRRNRAPKPKYLRIVSSPFAERNGMSYRIFHYVKSSRNDIIRCTRASVGIVWESKCRRLPVLGHFGYLLTFEANWMRRIIVNNNFRLLQSHPNGNWEYFSFSVFWSIYSSRACSRTAKPHTHTKPECAETSLNSARQKVMVNIHHFLQVVLLFKLLVKTFHVQWTLRRLRHYRQLCAIVVWVCETCKTFPIHPSVQGPRWLCAARQRPHFSPGPGIPHISPFPSK